MKESEKNLTIFRYLMTIARREGADNIRIRLIVSDGLNVALLNGGGDTHLLPHKSVDVDSDGDELKDTILYAVEDLGLDVSKVGRYLGSREKNNGNGLTKCFDFEVFVKRKKVKEIKWMKSSDIDNLNMASDEKRILRGYFRRK